MRRKVIAGLLAGWVVLGVVRTWGQEQSVRREHPRLWLTPETTGVLKGQAGKLTDSSMLSKALSYALSGDRTKGREAITMARELLPVTLGRLEAWPGYAKSYIHPAALCYDWCHDLLTEEERKEFLQAMSQWAAWCARKGETEDPYGSVFYGCLWGEAVIGLATWGDHPSAGEWVRHARLELFEKRALPALQRMGGDWLEGNGTYYGPLLLAFYAEAQKTACGEDLYAKTSFFREAVLYHLYASDATFRFFYPTGDLNSGWHGFAEGRPAYGWYPEHRFFLCLARNNLRDTPEASRAQWLLEKLPGVGHLEEVRLPSDTQRSGGRPVLQSVPFAELLWNRDECKVQPLAPDDLPQAYCNRRSGFVAMRGSWKEDAVVVGFHSGPHLARRQHLDQNSFSVFGQKELLVGPLMGVLTGESGRDVEDSYGKCTLLLDHHGQIGGEFSEDAGRILAFGQSDRWVYVVGDAAAAYNSRHFSYAPARQFIRHVLFLRPATLLVLDRVVTSGQMTKRWGAWAVAPLEGSGEGNDPWYRVKVASGKKASGPDVTFSWAPLLPRNPVVKVSVVRVPYAGNSPCRLEVSTDQADLFVNVFSFQREPPPVVTTQVAGERVEVNLEGATKSQVVLAPGDPQQGAITIREGANTVYSGPLLKGPE